MLPYCRYVTLYVLCTKTTLSRTFAPYVLMWYDIMYLHRSMCCSSIYLYEKTIINRQRVVLFLISIANMLFAHPDHVSALHHTCSAAVDLLGYVRAPHIWDALSSCRNSPVRGANCYWSSWRRIQQHASTQMSTTYRSRNHRKYWATFVDTDLRTLKTLERLSTETQLKL